MASRASVPASPLVPHDRAKAWLYRQLYNAVHVNRTTTATQIAIDSGVPLSCIQSYMKGTAAERKEACVSYALSIAVVLGKDVVNSLLAEIGYGGATPLDEPDSLQPVRVVAECMKNFAVIAEAATNNVFEEHEQSDVSGAADGIIATLLPISSAGLAA